ncbi:glycosyltransferase involved in cell wall biosynthesis [Rhodopseudomonas thermotolerans]|uniref:Glycosyltransferase involved in cell wall biosynthesis n=2 Tax=Rhodopseudomonas TaxID=1073 RepID=A0A336JXQ9_9BRAD|nr:glycosyltransferase involved in cell wall biosynthesis [Rhodopseudomonas pentothenatexigens]REG03624.1 glycosyltransferase involved in cell wall biosynthesis [Rhodopseudomonas thermotolerans]SSW90811.1 glycosyltransferase involved in cell wall bisynthesis [Rhodopseudomonas pentothenatexigens]
MNDQITLAEPALTADARAPRAHARAAATRSSAIPTRRRVLLIQTQAENAGAQEISRLVGAGLAARGYEVHNLFFFRQSRGFDEPANTTYCAPRRPGDPMSFLRFLVSLGRRIRATRPDAILTFQHYGNAIGGAIARLVSPAPVIANQVSARLTMPGWLQKLDLMMGRLGIFHTITVNSDEMMRDYSRYPESYRKHLTHVPHGFDQKHSTLSKTEARRRFGLPVDEIVLGTAARLHPLKQLDAAIRVLPAHPTWRLALAGHGPDEARLRKLAEQLGVADRLFLIGEITPDQVADFLACLDVFVFPSLAETFGLAAVEAAHAGVPVVANDLPVLREVLSYHGEPAALIVDAANAEALGAAVAAVLDDPELRVRLQRSGEGLKTRYSVEAMVDEYVRILEQAI